MRSSQPAEAIPHLTAALALDPNHVRAREQLEATLRWLGQPAEQKKAGPANAPGSTP
jgi:metal-dependent amidase/aminoacylase/carboxypeptidase family protein